MAKKLLYVSAWNQGPPRGGFRSAVTLLEHFSVWQPILWVGSGCEAAAIRETNVTVMEPGYQWRPSSRFGIPKTFSLAGDVLRALSCIRRLDFDCVVADYEICFPSAIASRLCRVPFSFYLRDTLTRPRPFKTRFLIGLCGHGIFLSRHLLETFESSSGRRLPKGFRSAIVPNSLSPAFFARSGERSPRRDGRFHVALVGAVTPKKNQLWFVHEVLPLLVAKIPSLVVDVFGNEADLPYSAALKQAVASCPSGRNVVLHDYCDDPFEMYAGVDVLVQASLREGIARAVLEAACFEIPTVALRSGGVEGYIRDGETGYVIGDAASMARRLLELAENPMQRQAMGVSARNRVAQEHHPQNVSRLFERVLADCCAGKRCN